MNEEKSQKVRNKIIGLLIKAKPPPNNISFEKSVALKELRNDRDLMILPADKGRTTLLLNRNVYEEKMNVLLSDRETYKICTRDPTPTLQRQDC